MKLLFSISYYTPYVSGLTLYVKRLAEKLAGNGFRCTVICNQHARNLQREENLNNVKVVRAVPFAVISKGFLSIDFIFKCFHLIRNNDVAVVSLPQFLRGF